MMKRIRILILTFKGDTFGPMKSVKRIFCLRGGNSANDIYWNCENYGRGGQGELVLVDGKQRLTSVLMFLQDKIAVFGKHRYSDFVDRLGTGSPRLHININSLKTRAEILQWYLDLNTGGVVHTNEEIEKVRRMLKKELSSNA